MRSLREVRSGGELTISYLQHADLCLPRPYRRLALWKSKEFVCKCHRCGRGCAETNTGDDCRRFLSEATINDGGEPDDVSLIPAMICGTANPVAAYLRPPGGGLYRVMGSSGAEKFLKGTAFHPAELECLRAIARFERGTEDGGVTAEDIRVLLEFKPRGLLANEHTTSPQHFLLRRLYRHQADAYAALNKFEDEARLRQSIWRSSCALLGEENPLCGLDRQEWAFAEEKAFGNLDLSDDARLEGEHQEAVLRSWDKAFAEDHHWNKLAAEGRFLPNLLSARI